MKLKKIASLALAGLMAVSMLAGCNNGNSGSSSSEGSTVVTVSAADAMNAVQDVVEFEASTTLDAWLASATKKATYDMLKKATAAGTTLTAADAVYTRLGELVTKEYTLQDRVTKFTSAIGKDSTNLYLYLIDDVTSEESAVNAVAKQVTASATTYYPDLVLGKVSGTSGNATYTGYEATYTGEVSVAKVSKTNDEGKTASAYYVLVAVTQSVADTATTQTGVSGSLN